MIKDGKEDLEGVSRLFVAGFAPLLLKCTSIHPTSAEIAVLATAMPRLYQTV